MNANLEYIKARASVIMTGKPIKFFVIICRCYCIDGGVSKIFSKFLIEKDNLFFNV